MNLQQEQGKEVRSYKLRPASPVSHGFLPYPLGWDISPSRPLTSSVFSLLPLTTAHSRRDGTRVCSEPRFQAWATEKNLALAFSGDFYLQNSKKGSLFFAGEFQA